MIESIRCLIRSSVSLIFASNPKEAAEAADHEISREGRRIKEIMQIS